jgi:hypothetical protein
MVCAPIRLSLGDRSLVNVNRLYACRGQLERINVPFLPVAPPNRRSRLRPDLLDDPSFEKLDYRLLGLGASDRSAEPGNDRRAATQRSAAQVGCR